jgi:hypothetical protein
MRASEKFGPRLDAYCQHRNKEYGKDWVFVHPYALGSPKDSHDYIQQKYVLITYNMTPNDVQLQDLDAIIVMKAKSPPTAMVENDQDGRETASLSPSSSQSSQEDMDILNGETSIHQDAVEENVNHRMWEQAMLQLRNEKANLESIVREQQVKIQQQETPIKSLKTHNEQLMQNNIRLRQAGRAQHAVQTPRRHQLGPRPAGLQVPFPRMGFGPGPTAITRPGQAIARAPPSTKPTAFMARLEAAREPVQRITPHKGAQPFCFPMQQGSTPHESVQRSSSRERMQQFRFPMPSGQGSLPGFADNGGLPFDGGNNIWGIEGEKEAVECDEGEGVDVDDQMEDD